MIRRWMVAAAMVISAAGLAACGGGGYDTSYACEQAMACAEEMSVAAPVSQSTCEANGDAIYAALSGEQKDAADRAFEACKSKTSCDFELCLQGQ